MQIFWPENSYSLSAKALDDKRLNKQIVELGQILSTAVWIEHCSAAEYLYSKGQIYLPTHENHPVVKACKYSYDAVVSYMLALLMEYSFRFNRVYRRYITFSLFGGLFSSYPQTTFQNHTTNHKHIKDTNEAYRQCLIEKWQSDKNPPKWTKRNKPLWAK